MNKLTAAAMLFSIVGLSALTFFAFLTTPQLWPEYAQAEDIIERIETFRATQHRLPLHLTEVTTVHEPESGRIYYERVEDDRYTVSFAVTIGESYQYDSETKTWH